MNYIYVWYTYIIIAFLRFCIYLKLRFKALKKNTGDESSNSSTIYTKNCDQFSIFWRVMCNCGHCWYVLKLEQKREFLRGFVCSSGAWKQTSKNSLIYRYVDSVLSPFAFSFNLFHQLLPQRSTTAITLLGNNNLHSWFFFPHIIKILFSILSRASSTGRYDGPRSSISNSKLTYTLKDKIYLDTDNR